MVPSFPSHHSKLPQSQLRPKQPNKKMKRQTLRWCGTYEVGGGYPDDVLGAKDKDGTARDLGSSKLETAKFEAFLRGGEQVISVLEEMIVLLFTIWKLLAFVLKLVLRKLDYAAVYLFVLSAKIGRYTKK
ncbi:protein PEP-RELATED DEVELOPMENT ARRESTED 1, chloroplastic-like [Pyrus x bretschneideri]|uniref:protein PEP-RELATED DEVELOPMENT ARRESTED 1, chloroplastic-like n=1 Tax=Pyrus x bretschneideri TaxID=225117 RepID=UPI00202DF1DA|nr:protein PEP-RELATED DEVELOPMENT ARRESTED 1, chloroplastic-like [Pyrus x bretschneideri]XP_048447909.1 protein PEP-RELATED DEVELOPMENT ARRESTED 1, chloroplastic-like [Pyrus x bretschneideri]